MSLLLLVVSALHILILILLFVATLDKVSQRGGRGRLSLWPRPLALALPGELCLHPTLSREAPTPHFAIKSMLSHGTLPFSQPCLVSLTLPLFLYPSQSWWTLPGKESLNLWYDCTWNSDNKTWACSNVSENGEA